MPPKEAAQQDGRWRVVSISFDVCYTPRGDSTPPVPYKIVSEAVDAGKTIESVRFGGGAAFVLASELTCCTGDAPGIAGGCRSGVTGAVCYPLKASGSVNCGRSPMVRQGDPFGMNAPSHGGVWNALGVLIHEAAVTTLETVAAGMGAVEEAVDPYLDKTNQSILESQAKLRKGWNDLDAIRLDKLQKGLTLDELQAYGEGGMQAVQEAWEGIKQLPSTPWHETVGSIGAGVATGTFDALSEISSGLASGTPGHALGKQVVQVFMERATGGALKRVGLKDAAGHLDAAKRKVTTIDNVRASRAGSVGAMERKLKKRPGQSRPGRQKRAKMRDALEKERGRLAQSETDLASAKARQASLESPAASIADVGPSLPTKPVPTPSVSPSATPPPCPDFVDGKTNICINGPGNLGPP
jgi:hypothetical protein